MMERKAKDMGQEKLLMRMYSTGSETDSEEYLGGIRNFLDRIKAPSETLESMLHEAAVYIGAFTQFREVSIGVKGQEGTFRYAALVGFNKDAEAARRKMEFSQKDLHDISVYRPTRFSRSSFYHLSEKKSYRPGSENTFNKPALLGIPRQRADDMIEGDYIEVDLVGNNREIIGWVEVSGPIMGKLPKRDTIRDLEFFASCLTLVLSKVL
jgi:hypothetical protein